MPMTHLLQVTEDHSIHNTGITSALDALMRQIAHMPNAIQQSLISTGDEIIPLPEGVSAISLHPSNLGRPWHYAPGAHRSLHQAVKQADLVHLHGIWMWVQWAAAKAARQQGKPFVLSIHGMLEPWIWQRQRWLHQMKKNLYWRLMAYPVFRYAGLIHAIHPIEAETLKKYFSNNDHRFDESKIEVIPHSLDLETIDLIQTEIGVHFPNGNPDLLHNTSSFSNDPYILFLGRLHPVKGIDLLIQAFALLEAPWVKLKIAGFTQEREAAYAAHLHQLVTDAGLGERVEFLGAVQGRQKWELLRNAWVFCLPSYSEVIGLVNLEAAACRTPVITTFATGIGLNWAENGGVLVEPETTAIAQALTHALHWSIQERIERGSSLRRLIETTYSWNATADRWMKLYERLGATR